MWLLTRYYTSAYSPINYVDINQYQTFYLALNFVLYFNGTFILFFSFNIIAISEILYQSQWALPAARRNSPSLLLSVCWTGLGFNRMIAPQNRLISRYICQNYSYQNIPFELYSVIYSCQKCANRIVIPKISASNWSYNDLDFGKLRSYVGENQNYLPTTFIYYD